LSTFRSTALFLIAFGVAALSTPALADAPKATILGVSDGRLRQQIEQAIGTAKAPPQSRYEARRRAESTADDVILVLRSEGYYEYAVQPDVGEGDQPQSVIKVTPGPRFILAAPKIEWAGAAPAAEAIRAGEASIGLTIGGPGRAADILAAEGRIVAAVAKRGYADAKIQPREVEVDHASRTVQATFHIQAGPRVRMDGVRINSKGRTKPAYVTRLLPWRAGAISDPEDIAELERRLRETGVYDAVSVALAPASEALPNGQRPVVVSLTDKPRSTLELGANYSTAEGSGVDGRWHVYNWVGVGDTITFEAQVANILSKGEVDLALPDFRQAGQTLKLSASIYKDDTSAYLENGARVATDVQRKVDKTDSVDLGLSFDVSRDQEPNVVNGALVTDYRRLFTVTGLLSTTLDHADNLLNPKRGWRLSTTLEPTASFGDGPIDYLKAQAQLSAYWPFDPSGFTDLAGRIHVGDIVGGNIPGVPAARRFYSGGGGSVRGYAYQDVGPRFPNNAPEGGISLLEGTAELRQQVYGPWAVAAFVDSGVLGTRENFDLSSVETGYGFGLRYDLGFAPLRADVAFPIETRRGDAPFQIYLSIGQSF
jgi:translocation and assembly module TamA